MLKYAATNNMRAPLAAVVRAIILNSGAGRDVAFAGFGVGNGGWVQPNGAIIQGMNNL